MNKKKLLISVVCLVFVGTTLAQVRTDIDPEFQEKTMFKSLTSQDLPVPALQIDCHVQPNLKFTVTDIASGKVSRMDCSDVNKIVQKKRAEYAEASEAAEKRAAANRYIIFSQASTGEWKRLNATAATEEEGRNAAKRQCIDRKIPGVSPNTAAKIVAPNGNEEVIQCTPKK